MQAVKLSTRLISAYMIYRAVLSFFAVLTAAVTFFSGIYSLIDGVRPGRWSIYTLGTSAIMLVEFGLFLWFAVAFYRSGPKVVRFLVGDVEGEPEASSSTDAM
jgi:hypothetical protein